MDKRRKLHPQRDGTLVSKTKPAHSSLEVGLNQEAIKAPTICYSDHEFFLTNTGKSWAVNKVALAQCHSQVAQVWLLGPHAFLRDWRLLEDIAAGSVKS